MRLIAGIGLGLIHTAAAYLIVKGVGALLRKHWRAGRAVLLGIVLLLVYVVLLGTLAYLLGTAHLDGTTIDPSQKARILAENISELMNISLWGTPLGLLMGAVVAVRDWQARPPDAFPGGVVSTPRQLESSVTSPAGVPPHVSRGQALTLGCLVGVDLITKVLATRLLRNDIELNPSASLQILLRVNHSGLGTWARALSGSPPAAQRAAAGVAWLTFTVCLVATRRTKWPLRLRFLVGCAAFAAALMCASFARPALGIIPGSILVAIGRLGPAALLIYLWYIAPPGLWLTTATLFAAAGLGNLLGLLVPPHGTIDFVYSRFLSAAFRQGVSNLADLYYDAALVCLAVAGMRTLAVRSRLVRAP